ncbi:hypothetical protein [Nocardia bovistercoris]|uniref:Uncharacterized protein n=1 Tax=Nocardia bovistercoris TaxID=2785916 RepID=A0A931IFQ2_9NOCA|nr:hypothetical protein [Nocardia bovistercoris]MBH0779596.1 hypothetical protein [Nocardia bovistercoris]
MSDDPRARPGAHRVDLSKAPRRKVELRKARRPTRQAAAAPPEGAPVTQVTARPRGARAVVIGVAAVVAVALALTVAAAVRDRGDNAPAAAPGVEANSSVIMDCPADPTLSVREFRAAGDAVDLTVDITAACPSGDVLSGSATRLTVVSTAATVATGEFDLSTAPVVIATDSVRRVFRFPAGTFWTPANAVSAGALRVGIVESGARPDLVATQASPSTAQVSTARPVIVGAADREAAAGLSATAESDRAVLQRDLLNRWVPQISSKRLGLVAEGRTWTDSEILREHLDLRARHPEARLLWSGSWSTFSYPDFWITVVGIAYTDPQAALGWCAAHGFDGDHCYAKLVSTTHPVQGSTFYQK